MLRHLRRNWAVGGLVACMGGMAIGSTAQAMSLAEAFDAALRNDAQFRAAGHDLETARLGVPIARAALLPAVTLSASGSDVVGKRSFPNSANQDVAVRVEYSAPQAALSLRMPIFNYEAISRVRQASAQYDGAEAIYRSRGSELVDRLTAAYLQVLLADEGRRLSTAQVESLAVQLSQAQQRLQRGEGTRVDAVQAQANLDVAKTRLIEAEDALTLAHRQLQRVTGVGTPPLKHVPTDYQPAPLAPGGLVEWLGLAVRQNPSLQAKEQALTAAKMGVQRNVAGHLPRVDLVASLSRAQNEMVSSLNQTSSLRSIGVQLNMPLYNGGGVDASVKQALSDQARAEEDIRVERENIEIEVQRHHQAVSNGASKIVAYQRAVESTTLALMGARRSLEAGQGTNNDVADAIARQFSARRDLAQARIEYLQARLRLMLQAGVAMLEVIADLDQALVADPAAATPSTR